MLPKAVLELEFPDSTALDDDSIEFIATLLRLRALTALLARIEGGGDEKGAAEPLA